MPDLDWELGLFRAGRMLLRRLRSRPPEHGPRAARLADHAAALTAFARGLSGRPVRIVACADGGGVRGLDLLLPETMGRGDDPELDRALYVLRVAVCAAAVRLGLTGAGAALRACAWLEAEWPGFAPLRDRLRPLGPDALIFGARFESAAPVEPRDAGDAGTARPSAPESEADAPRVGHIEHVRLEKDERGDIVWNPFERVETLDEYRGGSRNLDGADDLDAHLEALSEVDLGRVTRGGGPARSLLRADVRLDGDAPDVADEPAAAGGIRYDEWDFRTYSYRRGWCTVYPRRMREAEPGWAAATLLRERRRIDELARRIERQRAGLAPTGRQLDGDDVDLAALVDERAAARAGFGGDPRLYVRQARRRRDFATTVLLDVSLSTDAWIRGRRVLDVARDAVLVLGEVAARLGDRMRILAFASETRNRCEVWEILGWGEPWSLGRARLGALAPRGYTRIGPALRHASADLVSVAAERKLLLLVSDAKPNDYDRYEGRYGIADVRQALREAERAGLRTHGLAVDAVAREWLPALFGPGAWHALPRPELLPDVLTEVYGRLTLAQR